MSLLGYRRQFYHGLLARVLGDFHDHTLDVLDIDGPHLFPLPVEKVEGLLGTKADLDRTAGGLVEPFLHMDLVRLLAVVVLLPDQAMNTINMMEILNTLFSLFLLFAHLDCFIFRLLEFMSLTTP